MSRQMPRIMLLIRPITYVMAFKLDDNTFTLGVTWLVKFRRSLKEAEYRWCELDEVRNTDEWSLDKATYSEGTRSSVFSGPSFGPSNTIAYHRLRSGSNTTRCPPQRSPTYALVSPLNGLASTKTLVKVEPFSPLSSADSICNVW